MDADTFNSDRYFTIYDYHVSHGQLLLRSSKGAEHDSNIDVIFFGVKYIQLYTYLLGISIEVLSNFNIEIFDSQLLNKNFSRKSDHVFLIKVNEERFYIAAAFCKIYENRLEFHQSSLGVLEYKGRETEIGFLGRL